MTVHDTPVPDGSTDEPLELLTDDADVWTAVPTNASGEERVTMWLSVESDTLCDLEEWR
ncbi:hypothetical protein G6M89_21175 [Natronolimnobius sp. AArcel1]|uniref:DUF7511 domain-containing protein n=1 Tax=Natronolimnobius sp. AArcel1 TaxID=1679093 RepID=UPI0013EB8D21|nr:hypothetical protein [Natronolimnobius sp. AArcel1]NGM71463.1 hypothetical protein [Natronolimnobius sp. AArcel1]